jgi:hypothetical protein
MDDVCIEPHLRMTKIEKSSRDDKVVVFHERT